jgi:hypothetical protein
MRPGAYASVALCGVFAGLAVQQGLTAQQASAEASAMVGPGGALVPGADPSRYDALRGDASAASRNAWISAGAAVVFGATAAVLGWKTRVPEGKPAPAVALAF